MKTSVALVLLIKIYLVELVNCFLRTYCTWNCTNIYLGSVVNLQDADVCAFLANFDERIMEYS